jgi:integrase
MDNTVPNTLPFPGKSSEKQGRQRTKLDKIRLTKRAVEALEPPAPGPGGKTVQRWFYDDQTAHLAVCVYSLTPPNTDPTRTWFWVGKVPGDRMARIRIGKFPQVLPDEARQTADEMSYQVRHGIDPRDTGNRALRKELTLAELFDLYEEHAKLRKRTWQRDRDYFENHCGPFKPRALSTITASEIAALHTCVGKDHGPYSANRLLAVLSTVFGFAARQHGFTKASPTRGVERFPEQSRERFMSGDELSRFFTALDAEPALFRDYFRLLLWTGVRKSNLLAMRWEQVNLPEAVWHVPMTKNGKPLRVHLTAQAVDVLKSRQEKANGCPWVFPSRRPATQSHLSNADASWTRICKRAGLVNLRIHDLRRTLGSWMASGGTSLPIIGRTLGHTNQATTQVYARLTLDPIKGAVDSAVAAMTAAASANKEGGAE